MTKILVPCPDCKGTGTVPHVRRELVEGEVPNPNDLDRYKTDDVCEKCSGGKRLVEVTVNEDATASTSATCLRNGLWWPSPRSGKLI